MSPEAYAHLVRRTRELAPSVQAGLHPHNIRGALRGPNRYPAQQLTVLARAGEELTGYHLAWNHPVTGTSAFC